MPQNRERVFIIGIRDECDNHFNFPKKEILSKKLKDVLEEEIIDKYYLSEQAILKCLKSQANQNLLIKSVDDISRCIVSGYYKLPFDGQYIKVTSNLEKYYLSEKMINGFLLHNKRHIEEKNQTGFNWYPKSIEDIACCLRANGALCATDNSIKIPSATSQGYEEATDGDSINLSNPNSKTRRGRVGKEVAQTLDTGCNQAILSYTRDQKGKVISNHLKSISNTIHSSTGSGGNTDSYVYTKDMENFRVRRLTPRECFRLMDFPDSFIWNVSDSQAYKQAGNSIVVNVLYKILKNLNL